MKAMVYRTYGTPGVLELQDIDKPVPNDDQVLVRVRAASVNPYDWHMLTGTPYIVRTQAGLRRPKVPVPGVDFAGEVETVGRNVGHLQPGDEVFGMRGGAYAEYVCVRNVILKKPANLTFEQAAAVPMAALTALQGLRDRGRIRAGQRVLVVGASGGVGTFAVQIAKALGAEVTGVCATRNVEMVRGIGADHVIDYTERDYTRTGERYDLILDMVDDHSIAARKRALDPRGVLVVAGGKVMGNWIGPLVSPLGLMLASVVSGRKLTPMLAKSNRDDLATVRELLAAGTVTPVIDRSYALREVPQAIGYVGEGHARGKTVITV